MAIIVTDEGFRADDFPAAVRPLTEIEAVEEGGGVGFDEVEIDEALAQRQPEEQWLSRANWRDNWYQSRLRA